jgi:hypothetical protein
VEASDGGGVVGGLGSVTGSIACFVRIVIFGGDSSVGLDVLESVIHQTASAAMISAGIAIDQLLFTEGDQVFVVSNCACSFGGTNG